MPVSKRLRYEILRRDNHACRYCGAAAPDAKLTVDHVMPTTLGGGDEPSNLVAACVDCNAGKTSSHPDAPMVDDVAADAIRWRNAICKAWTEDVEQREVTIALRQGFLDSWNAYKTYPPRLPEGWQESIDQFHKAGLWDDDMDDAVEIVMRKRNLTGSDYWRYFCGICWKKIKQRQERAKQLIDEGVI